MRKHLPTKLTICLLLIAIISALPTSQAQVNFTANDAVRPYIGGFRAGVNFDIYRGFSDEDLAMLAAGSDYHGVSGVQAKAIRPAFFENFAELFGYDSRLSTMRFYDSLGLKDNTLMVGFPSDEHRDPTRYCPDYQSTVFKNLYAPIWDNGENGTPVNDTNYYALYIWKTVSRYHKYVKFFEVWNEPGYDYTGGKGWLPRGASGSWWDNNPEPCDYKLRAPIFTYIRMLRITYEIVKTINPNCYVMTSGLGYPSFLDAILRNTDNPNGGQVTPQYPKRGGAYFDGIGYHAYPHFDDALRQWNNSRQTWDYSRHSDAAAKDPERIKNQFEDVLKNYGYNGTMYPKKTYIITESNIPRKEFGEYIGSADAQKNWIPKVLVNCIKNDIWQLHVFKIAEETDSSTATYEFDVMGLYKKIHYSNKTRPELTEEGWAFKTASQILFGKVYDAAKTQQMNLPTNVEGVALRDTNSIYTYCLWAKTTVDKNETANAIYSFPISFGSDLLIKQNLDYAATLKLDAVSPQNIVLTATPIFLTERKIRLSQQNICEGSTISFDDLTPSVSRTWTIEIAPNQTITETVKSFVKTFSVRGNYAVHMVAKDANGNELTRQTLNINVEKPPVANFSATVQNPSVILKNMSTTNVDSLRWDFSDGSKSNLPDLTKTFYNSGNFTLKLTVSNRCGSHNLQKTVSIAAPRAPQIAKTANDTTPQYNKPFRAGVNMRFVEGWTDEQIADIAAGNREQPNLGTQGGIGAKSLRTMLPEYFTKFWGANVRTRTFQHYQNIDLQDIVLTLGSPDSAHRDPNFYCYSEQSAFFKNMYTDIFDNGANGTIVNDTNYFAKYVFDLVRLYKDEVKFWEVWDTPGWDIEGKNGWKPRNWQHNWWENNPDPCELGTKAPIQHLVRMMRIAYEVIKREDPSAFVVYSGSGFASFLDAVCRNTDNPTDGSTTPQYPFGGGAYFDAVLYNVFPHFDGTLAAFDQNLGRVVYKRNSDEAIKSITTQRDSLQSILKKYGYDGQRSPRKQFIIGEINVPRKPMGTMGFGSDEVQKNFIIKSYITAATNGVLQMNVKSISEESTFEEATDGSQLMGLYQKLTEQPYHRTANIQGFAFKTVSEILFSQTYDSARTKMLNLPLSVRGAAFKNSANKYTYVLWAKASDDLSEWGSASYSFPNSLPINRLYKREWSWSQNKTMSTVTAQNIPLSTTPIFLSEDSVILRSPLAAFSSDTRVACPPLTVKFTDNSADAVSYLWHFDGGIPSLSTDKNPTVVYRQSGKYDVVLEVRNAQGVHAHRKIEYIEVAPAPKADFRWSRPNDTSLLINFVSASQNSFTMIWDFGDGTGDFSLNPSHRYKQKGIYRIRLIAVNDCGRDTIFKTIDLSGTSLKEPTQIAHFQYFPNPFETDLTVQFHLTEPSHIGFDLFDVSGKLVEILSSWRFYTEGSHNMQFSPKDMPKGMYILRLKTDKQVIYKQIVKM
ncbi:MAG: PKD domain-containing protein [Saprospiraceae bacterium]|nr:PKD domain-containing protein [Saprospiraceae bacterium]